jgi:hypothetical protein
MKRDDGSKEKRGMKSSWWKVEAERRRVDRRDDAL